MAPPPAYRPPQPFRGISPIQTTALPQASHYVIQQTPHLSGRQQFKAGARGGDGGAPPVYRPNAPAQAKPLAPGVGSAPPVYRPNRIAQAKTLGPGVGGAPPVYRPMSATSQAKGIKAACTQAQHVRNSVALQAGMAPSLGEPIFPDRAAKRVLQSSPVVQRMIVIDGNTYGADDLEKFRATYSKDEDAILHGMEMSDIYVDISSALESPRRFFVTAQKGEEGTTEFSVYAEAEKRTVPGGVTRGVNALPELAKRPAEGFEN
jgi:hypothetical protein